MSLIRSKRKCGLLFTTLILSSILSGCASTMERAIGSAFEAVVETTVEFVVDTTVDVIIKPAAEAVVDSTINAAIACIDNDKPVLRGALPNPILNQEYEGLINVSIRNEPYDSSYDYNFSLYGDIPPGMTTKNSGRQIRLMGRPTVPGVYNFSVGVQVDDGPYGANKTKGLCFTTDKEHFQWTISQSEPHELPQKKSVTGRPI